MSTFASERAALGWHKDGAFRDSTHPEAVERTNGERGFKLKLHENNPEAPLSPFFFNLRIKDNPKPGPLTAETVSDSAAALYHMIRELEVEFDHICGLPNAGEPFARDLLTLERAYGIETVSLLHLRKEEVRGKRRVVGPPEGSYSPGETVLVVDDLITGADTKLEGIKALEEAGLVVKDVVVLLDREQGGTSQLQAQGYALHAVWGLKALLQFYRDRGMISADCHNKIMEYVSLT